MCGGRPVFLLIARATCWNFFEVTQIKVECFSERLDSDRITGWSQPGSRLVGRHLREGRTHQTETNRERVNVKWLEEELNS